MSRRNYDLVRDIESLTLAHSTWIHSVFLHAGGGGGAPYDDSWIQPEFNALSGWASASLDALRATKQDSFDLASKADTSWVTSLGNWIGTKADSSWVSASLSALQATKADSAWVNDDLNTLAAAIATKQNSFNLASKADSSWVASLGVYVTAVDTKVGTKADSSWVSSLGNWISSIAGGTGGGGTAQPDIYKCIDTTFVFTTGVNSGPQQWLPPAGTVAVSATNYDFEGFLVINHASQANEIFVSWAGASNLDHLEYVVGGWIGDLQPATLKLSAQQGLGDTSANSSGGGVAQVVWVKGRMTVSTPSSFTPQFRLKVAPSSLQVMAGSYWRMRDIGAGNPSGGSWS